jgi:hypothetical protein
MRDLVKGLMALAICAVTAGAPAFAQTANGASAMSETSGATTGLGSSHRFASPDAASAHCPGDVVVWAPDHGLHYFTPDMPGYAKNGSGFYACKMEADNAGFSPKQG